MNDITLLRQIAAGLPQDSALRHLFTPDMLAWCETALRENRKPDLYSAYAFHKRLLGVSRDALKQSQVTLIKAQADVQACRTAVFNVRLELDALARTHQQLADKYIALNANRQQIIHSATTRIHTQAAEMNALKARLYEVTAH